MPTRSWVTWRRALLAVALVAAAAPDGRADDESPYHVDIALGGGTAMAFDEGLSTGHLLWFGVWVGYHDFAFGVTGSSVYPGSRVQTRFGAWALDGRWFLTGRRHDLRPFVSVGLGLTTADALEGRPLGDGMTRWASGGAALFTTGLGLRWGPSGGLFIQTEARLVNASHAAFTLGGGASF